MGSRGKTASQEYALKKIFFDEVMVREYPRILGDNPAVSDGAPVTIDWKEQDTYMININVYEHTRAPVRRKKRKKLLLSATKRLKILIDAGYNIEEIGEAILDVEKSKRERILSVRSTGWNVPLDFVSGAAKVTGTALHVAAKTTGTAVVKVGRRSSKILKES